MDITKIITKLTYFDISSDIKDRIVIFGYLLAVLGTVFYIYKVIWIFTGLL